jgi:MFS transporter, UMF1 family
MSSPKAADTFDGASGAPSFWKRRDVWAWALYDFANSAFATTILAVVFNVYFVQRVVPAEGYPIFGARVPGPALWGYTVSFSMLLTFLLAPLLGAWADGSGKKKLFLALHWAAGSAACAALFFATPGRTGLAMGFFVAANVGFSGSNVFYNAFLPQLSTPRNLGRVSGLGWALGYVGGGLCLALNLLIIKSPQSFGLSTENFLPVRASFLCAGAWWFFFGLPLLFWVEEKRGPAGRAFSARALSAAWARLLETFRHVRRYSNLAKYLAAYVVYNDGIETVILMASLFGAQALGMPADELILCFLMIQGVAFAGSLAFGWLADRIQHKRTIFITLAVFSAAVLWAAGMESAREFWFLGAVVGLVLGGSQAASRSLAALLIPPDKSAEFFSFFGLAGKLTSALGPLLFGAVSQAAGLRAGVLSLLVFFVLGGGLLLFVQEPDRRETGGQ